jgi:hypothetical protein
LCLQTRNNRRAKMAADIKAKNVNAGDNTDEEFVVTALT